MHYFTKGLLHGVLISIVLILAAIYLTGCSGWVLHKDKNVAAVKQEQKNQKRNILKTYGSGL